MDESLSLRTAEVGRIADAERTADRRQHLRETAATMRKVRWIAALFVWIQFSLYQAPEGLELPFPRLPVALAFFTAIVAINLVSFAASRFESVRALTITGTLELAADTAVVLAVTWVFAFDPSSALWALLVIPVLEGAVRAQFVGAVATWAAVVSGYTLRDLWKAEHYDYLVFEPESLTYRGGIVLIVAVTVGLLARNLTLTAERLAVQVRAHRDAQAESEHRAELLHIVAAAGRHMTTADLDELLAVVVDSVIEMGFDGAAICVLDEEWATFTVPHSVGMPDSDPERRRPAQDGPIGTVLAEQRTVAVDEYAPWFGRLGRVGATAVRGAIATPVRAGGELVAVLVAVTARRKALSPHEIECLELLAAQAGAAVSNSQRFAERRTFQEQLEHQAHHDALTGLPNRTFFLDKLDRVLAGGEGGRGMVGVLYLGLDRFKTVNDSFGHDFGDALLAAVAERLRSCVREHDVVARLGSDEFTVLLERGVNAPDDAVRVAQRIIETLDRPVRLRDRELAVSTSIGIAFGRRGRAEPRDLLRDADLAMYRAKEDGRNRYAVAPADWTTIDLEPDLPAEERPKDYR